ncbi:MAG TPA: hypothetical protein VMT54_04625, partial [Candidatus Cybelea sp.]|nr:hypothetical protein [Candidatus Cybelea sp.]
MATLTFTSTNGDLLVGSTGNDTFTLKNDADLDATDTALGQGGHDKLIVTNVNSSLTDGQFAGVHNIQELDYGNTVKSVQLTAGADFGAAGFTLVDASLVTGAVAINALGDTSGHLTLSGGLGDNSLSGSASNDVFKIRADTFNSNDFVTGNGHATPVANGDLANREGDVLQLYETAGSVSIVDTAFVQTGVDTLALAGAATFNVTLGANGQAHGIDIVDASAATGNVTVDVSGRTDATEVLFSGTGLTATDKVTGTFGLTTLGITTKAAVLDTAFTQVKGVHTVEVLNNAATTDYTGAKITLGAKSLAAGINKVVNSSDHDLTVDASARMDNFVFLGSIGTDSFIGAQGQNTFFAGAGDDALTLTVAGFNAADTYVGGDGTDALHISSSDGKTAIVDADFADLSSVEKLVFDAAGKQNVTLAGNADAMGLATVDGSKITGGLTLDSSGMANDISILMSTGIDTLSIGAGSKVIVASKFLTGADTITGGGGGFSELHFTDAVKLTDAFFAGLHTNVTNMNVLSFDNTAAGQSLVA